MNTITKNYMIALDALPNLSGVLDDDQFRAIAAHLLYLPQPSIKSEAVGLQLHDVSGAAQALRHDARGRCLFDPVLSNSGAEYTRQHDQFVSSLASKLRASRSPLRMSASSASERRAPRLA